MAELGHGSGCRAQHPKPWVLSPTGAAGFCPPRPDSLPGEQSTHHLSGRAWMLERIGRRALFPARHPKAEMRASLVPLQGEVELVSGCSVVGEPPGVSSNFVPPSSGAGGEALPGGERINISPKPPHFWRCKALGAPHPWQENDTHTFCQNNPLPLRVHRISQERSKPRTWDPKARKWVSAGGCTSPWVVECSWQRHPS